MNGNYPRWSPDGKTILFTLPRPYQSGMPTNQSDIDVIGPDGSGQRKVVDGIFGGGGVWSPDSSRFLVYCDAPHYLPP